MFNLRNFLERRKRAKIINFLRTANPEKIEKAGEKLLIPAFLRAATRVPAYRKILEERNLNYKEIKDIESFKRFVPIIDKETIFPKFEIEELCIDGNLNRMKSAVTSSGFSGIYSYGIITEKNNRLTAQATDVSLDYAFDISNKKTFLINCLPMGVRIYTSLPIAETSVRSDMALAVIKKISPKFEQTLIASDPHFLKELVEEGNKQGINWKKLNISLISGGDWFSESFRSYLAHLIELDLENPQGRLIGATFGIAELDLNLFHESWQTILIRRKSQENKNLRETIFGKETKISPILCHYYPHRIFLEALPVKAKEKELVFSILSKGNIMPLIRYNSKDCGQIISYNQLKEILIKQGYNNLIPELKLPLVALSGRKDNYLEIDEKRIYPEEIKQGLYEDFEVASKTTGYFRLGKDQNGPKLEIQLKKEILINNILKSKFEQALLKYVDTVIPVIIYHYQDFPYAMKLDYETKFKNL